MRDPSKTFTERINFRVTDEQKKYILKRASEHGMSIATYVRAIAVDRIANNVERKEK